jgi:hypothetical protein
MIFFYELLFALMAVAAIFVGEVWNRFAAFVFLGGWFLVVVLGSASFDARLATSDGLTDDDRRWFTDARDGLRHVRLLFGLATLAALAWRLIAG